ncbi:hypothetical protein BJ508DRAFT_362185 [Ascobolus immersus RN42]|uniref:Uncharacterized protein n=1 Tax=Ascobolus immersus RN42 TaxID=1160509 RepID=A0A3N4I652_ASCIM|nr:hypothetical protein BJ508DRAFT_362185 [Ascobolus immersus RN42]
MATPPAVIPDSPVIVLTEYGLPLRPVGSVEDPPATNGQNDTGTPKFFMVFTKPQNGEAIPVGETYEVMYEFDFIDYRRYPELLSANLYGRYKNEDFSFVLDMLDHGTRTFTDFRPSYKNNGSFLWHPSKSLSTSMVYRMQLDFAETIFVLAEEVPPLRRYLQTYMANGVTFKLKSDFDASEPPTIASQNKTIDNPTSSNGATASTGPAGSKTVQALPEKPPEPSRKSVSIGSIAGGVLGGVFLLAFLLGLYVWRRRRSSRPVSASTGVILNREKAYLEKAPVELDGIPCSEVDGVGLSELDAVKRLSSDGGDVVDLDRLEEGRIDGDDLAITR